MVIRLNWQEVADIVAKNFTVPGLLLGEPRIMNRAPYGEEEQVENPVLEFPILDTPKAPDVPRSGPELLAVGTPAIDDDLPF